MAYGRSWPVSWAAVAKVCQGEGEEDFEKCRLTNRHLAHGRSQGHAGTEKNSTVSVQSSVDKTKLGASPGACKWGSVKEIETPSSRFIF